MSEHDRRLLGSAVGSPDSSLIRRQERSGERMRLQCRMEAEEDEEEGEKWIERKKSRRQQSKWNMRGDQRVKEEEEEGGALRKTTFYLLHELRKNISDHQRKF